MLSVVVLLAAGVNASPASKKLVDSKWSDYTTSVSRCGPAGSAGQLIKLKLSAQPRAARVASTASFATRLASRSGVRVRKAFSMVPMVAAEASPAKVHELLADPLVERVEADCIITLSDPELASIGPTDDHNPPVSISGVTNEATWGIDRVDQRDLPLSTTFRYGSATGSNSRLYILDTGVRITNEDFGGRAVPGWSAGCDSESGCSGWNYQGVIDDANPCHWHGTHCASTAGGTTYGVAKEATIVTVQVLSCSGSGSYSQVMEGIQWAVDDANSPENSGQASVISMSLGGGFSQAVNDEVDAAVEAGVAVVVAAGNDDWDACDGGTKVSPASAEKAITVGATTSSDERSSFSSYGPCVNILAPGSSITAADSSTDTATRSASGTSMACPHVAGAAAVLMSANPGLTALEVVDKLDCMATADTISGVPAGTPNKLLFAGISMGTPEYMSCSRPPSSPVPAPAPPRNPFPPTGDENGPVAVEVVVTPDYWAHEISWKITSLCESPWCTGVPNTVIFEGDCNTAGCIDGPSGGIGPPTTSTYLLPKNADFTFQIFDTWGDGILSGGGCEVRVGTCVLQTIPGSSYGSASLVYSLQASCSDSPTSAPVASPVASPTSAPVASPVASPTSAPVANPTPSPTPSPGPSPTSAPVASPVASPTSAPVATPSPVIPNAEEMWSNLTHHIKSDDETVPEFQLRCKTHCGLMGNCRGFVVSICQHGHYYCVTQTVHQDVGWIKPDDSTYIKATTTAAGSVMNGLVSAPSKAAPSKAVAAVDLASSPPPAPHGTNRENVEVDVTVQGNPLDWRVGFFSFLFFQLGLLVGAIGCRVFASQRGATDKTARLTHPVGDGSVAVRIGPVSRSPAS